MTDEPRIETHIPNPDAQEQLEPAQEVHPKTQSLSGISIGRHLAAYREGKGLNLKSISQKTRISYSILKYIEEDALDALPDPTYVRGFIKSYAKEVGANPEECLRILDQCYEEHHVEKKALEGLQADTFIQKNKIALPKSYQVFQEILNPNRVKIAGGVALGGLLLFGLFSLIQSGPSPESETVETFPKNESAKVAAAQKPVEIVTAVEPSDQALETEPEAMPVKKPGPSKTEMIKAEKEEKKESEPIAPKPEPEAKKETADTEARPKKPTLTAFTLPLFKVLPDAPENTDDSIFPPHYRQAPLADKENVFIHATQEDTWLTYKSDEREVKSFILKKGRMLLIRGSDIRLFLGKAKAVKVFYNNQLISYDASTGVKSLVFPKKLVEKYQLPLFIYDKEKGHMLTSDEYLKSFED